MTRNKKRLNEIAKLWVHSSTNSFFSLSTCFCYRYLLGDSGTQDCKQLEQSSSPWKRWRYSTKWHACLLIGSKDKLQKAILKFLRKSSSKRNITKREITLLIKLRKFQSQFWKHCCIKQSNKMLYLTTSKISQVFLPY